MMLKDKSALGADASLVPVIHEIARIYVVELVK